MLEILIISYKYPITSNTDRAAVRLTPRGPQFQNSPIAEESIGSAAPLTSRRSNAEKLIGSKPGLAKYIQEDPVLQPPQFSFFDCNGMSLVDVANYLQTRTAHSSGSLIGHLAKHRPSLIVGDRCLLDLRWQILFVGL